MLRLNDVFFTLQGEGFHSGRRALFVRMPFCNLACSWCDTQFNSYKNWTEEDFKAFATQEDCRFAVLTGGEPMMNKQSPAVIKILKDLGFYISCESNGTFPILEGIDFATVSPKRDAGYDIDEDAFKHASEFKYVVDEGFDWSVLQRHNTADGRRYSLSPEFNRFTESMNEIMAYIKENPQWRYSLQTHKLLGIP